MKETAKIVSVAAVLLIAAGLGVLAVTLNKEPAPEAKPTPIVELPPPTNAPTEAPTLPLYDYVPTELGKTEKAKQLLNINRDYMGWIKIENTDVDYPFVKDPGEIHEDNNYYGNSYYGINEFYLHHDFDKREYEFAGTLFMDYCDNFEAVEELQSENIVIYGHNMANNTMFGSLRRYRQDYDFYKDAAFVELSNSYRDYDYVICCCFITGGNYYSDFLYWQMEELDTEKEFNDYVDTVRSKQLFDTGVDLKYGDKLLTLSTCYASEDNSRFVIVARRLRDGEIAGDLDSIEKTEEYIKAQEEKKKQEEKEKKETDNSEDSH